MQRVNVHKKSAYTGHKAGIYAVERFTAISAPIDTDTPANTLAHSPEFQFITAGGDGIVAGWDSAGVGHALARTPVPIYALRRLDIGRLNKGLVAIGQNDGGIRVLNLNTRSELLSTQVHLKAVFDFMPLHTGGFVAVGGDGAFSIWQPPIVPPTATEDAVIFDLESNDYQCVSYKVISTQSLRTIALHPSGKLMAIGSSDHHIRIYALPDFNCVAEWEAHLNSVFSLVFEPATGRLISGSRDARLKVWDTEAIISSNAKSRFTPLWEGIAHLFTLNHVAITPGGHYFATASMDKTIKLWDAADYKLLKVIDHARNASHSTGVNRLLWLNDTELVSVADDAVVIHWQIDW